MPDEVIELRTSEERWLEKYVADTVNYFFDEGVPPERISAFAIPMFCWLERSRQGRWHQAPLIVDDRGDHAQ